MGRIVNVRIGERIASVETALGSLEKRFDEFEDKLDDLRDSDAQRRGREKGKAFMFTVGGGFIGGIITALGEWMRH